MALIILLLITVAAWLVLRWLNPQLRPISARSCPNVSFIYSANGNGYPAIEFTGSFDNENYKLYHLDDLGNRLPGVGKPGETAVSPSLMLGLDCLSCENPTDEVAVSPTRQVLAWYDEGSSTDKGVMVYAWKDGHITRIPCEKGIKYPQISDDGLMHWDRSSLPRYRTTDGRLVVPELSPAHGWKYAMDIESLDPNLLPLLRGKNLYIYNLTSKRIEVKFPPAHREEDWNQGMVLRHGTRIAAIPSNGTAMIWDGITMTSLPIKGSTKWFWGEDGSVWTYSGNQLSVLQWRQSSPRLERLPYSAQFDSQSFDSITENAVWGDGELIAHTESLTRTPAAIERAIRAACDRINRPYPELPTMSQQLSLYRRNRLLGRFRVSIQAQNVNSYYLGNKYSEHLAFTADGRYLSWVVDSKAETHSLYVFPTGR